VVLPLLAEDGVNYVLLSGHHSPGGYASLTPYRLTRLFSVGRDVDPFSYERRGDFDFVAHPALLDLLGVRYLLASDASVIARITTARGGSQPLTETRPDYALAIRDSYLPRSFFVNRAIIAPGEDAAFREVTGGAFDPRQQVVIERDTAVKRGATDVAAPSYVPAVVTDYAATRVVVEVDAPTSGWLVLLDAFAPGWTAKVNGVRLPIERADYLFRAVWVDSGRTRAVFEYSNGALRVGAVASVTTLAFALLAVLILARRGAS
jgi:hypothetical protein